MNIHKALKQLNSDCSLTGKRCFETQKGAKAARKRYRSKKNSKDHNIRSYECDHCGYWHNTSMSLSEYEKSNASNASE